MAEALILPQFIPPSVDLSNYALKSHSHSGYASSSHSHSGYASSSHSHSQYATQTWVSANFAPIGSLGGEPTLLVATSCNVTYYSSSLELDSSGDPANVTPSLTFSKPVKRVDCILNGETNGFTLTPGEKYVPYVSQDFRLSRDGLKFWYLSPASFGGHRVLSVKAYA